MDLDRIGDGGPIALPSRLLVGEGERLRRALLASLSAIATPAGVMRVAGDRELEMAARAYGEALRGSGLADAERLERVRSLVYGTTPPYYREAPPREITTLADQVVAWCLDAGRGSTDRRSTAPPATPGGRRRSRFGPYDRRRR